LVEGWRRLYRRAAGAITRFTPGDKSLTRDQDLAAVPSVGWGVLAAEVFDDDDRIVVRLEVPGLEKDDLDLQLMEDVLVIRGEKQAQRERTEGRYHIAECAYGSFARTIPLPEEVEADQAQASYRKGVLRIELPKVASSRRKTIKIDVH
jgi:HSP20 family protein